MSELFACRPAVVEAIHAGGSITSQPLRRGGSAARNGGTVIVDLVGTLEKRLSWLSWYLGGSSTMEAAEAIAVAAAEPNVSAIVLRIDSPGGTVAGTEALANTVAAAASRKPVIAYIEDLAASAAYWIAAQATRIGANASALVGGVGTYAVAYDRSEQFRKAGVTVHIVRAGQFKGSFEEGARVTDEALAEAQRVVNDTNRLFVRAVAAGRRMTLERAETLADGRVHLAAQAKALGLIDAVVGFAAVLADPIGFAGGARGPSAATAPPTREAIEARTRQLQASGVYPPLARERAMSEARRKQYDALRAGGIDKREATKIMNPNWRVL